MSAVAMTALRPRVALGVTCRLLVTALRVLMPFVVRGALAGWIPH